MATVPLIHMSQFRPFTSFLSDIGAPIQRLLEDAKLPIAVHDNPSDFVAARSAWEFVNRAAVSQGVPDIGWRVIEAATLETFGSWGRHVTTAHTLRDAIAALAYWHQKEAPIARTGLGDGGDHAWLWRVRTAKLDRCPGNEPVEQYTLGRLVKVVRLVGGKDWIPTHVKLESQAGESRLSRVLHGCRIEYRQTLLAIAVPWEMLDQPLPRPEPLPPTSVQPGDLQEAHCDFAGSLRQALAPLVTERPLNLALAAELSLVSERSLKRRLAEEGKTWRHVLDQVHLDAALPMLTDTNTSISEIAQWLQYSDHAHFTRAFHRWTGQTPSAFRHRHWRVNGPTVE